MAFVTSAAFLRCTLRSTCIRTTRGVCATSRFLGTTAATESESHVTLMHIEVQRPLLLAKCSQTMVLRSAAAGSPGNGGAHQSVQTSLPEVVHTDCQAPPPQFLTSRSCVGPRIGISNSFPVTLLLLAQEHHQENHRSKSMFLSSGCALELPGESFCCC